MMELDESLETLKIGTLKDMSIDDLEAKIHECVTADVYQSKIFNILMEWLNEQIKQDVITEDLLERFVNLLHMHDHAEIKPLSLAQVDEVFNEWLRKNTIQSPTYTRRYLIIQQDIHHLFTNKRAQQSISLARDETVEIDKSNRSRDSMHMSEALPRQLSDTHLKDAGADDVAIAEETNIISPFPDTKMSRKSTRAGRRRRKHKSSSDTPEPPTLPENYICKRCDEPGHLIQHCPTNLNPRYDRLPARDYLCYFCGRRGAHFSTLCPKNPSESSLTKQRQYASVDIREPRTPTRSSTPYYMDREASAIRTQDRYRSRSPNQRHRDYYRPRSPERHRSHRSGHDTYSPHYLDRDDEYWSRRRGELDVSPYTSRVRLTRELNMSLDAIEGKESSSRPRHDSSRSQRGSSSSSPLHYYHSPLPKKTLQRHRGLDKATRGSEEGRLAYEDDIYALAGAKASPSLPMADPSQNTLSISEKEVTKAATPSAIVASEDLDEPKDEVENFLRALAANIMLNDEDNFPPVVTGTDGVATEIDCDPSSEPESPTVQTIPNPTHRLVQCPPFSPRVVSLFRLRENPIVNVSTNRKTASQMMKRSDVSRQVKARIGV
ncbi:hypothetical protein GQX73_g2525 [Xylaria multiplex]|uniref:CCHC-type domain-containing protein n=1 Tax=Xylaria multiplex TaxID=323545 RepID=A0A7C8MXR1_9PEZI|nr:hypothetical protein GQX73_g2525 [Xylaria multiplex]